MRTGYVKRLYLPNVSDGAAEWIMPALLGGVFFLGAIFGRSLWGRISETSANLLLVLISGERQETFNFLTYWGASFFSNITLVLLLFLCGFCAISQPVVLAVPFIKGLGFGLVAAGNAKSFSPYSSFFWLSFMPGAFLTVAAVIVAAKESLMMSGSVFSAVFTPQRSGRCYTGAYCGKYLLIALATVAVSLIDTVFDMVYTIISH